MGCLNSSTSMTKHRHVDKKVSICPPGRPACERFHVVAQLVSLAVASPYAFVIAFLLVVLWLLSGPVFHFSDTWQLVINTATTIITFLMVFLIQNMQNRDTKAIHLKLDELLRGVKGARNNFINLENLSEVELDHLQKEFEKLRRTKGR